MVDSRPFYGVVEKQARWAANEVEVWLTRDEVREACNFFFDQFLFHIEPGGRERLIYGVQLEP